MRNRSRNTGPAALLLIRPADIPEPPKKHPQIAKLEAQIAGKEKLPAEEVWKEHPKPAFAPEK